jgi:hypothetical protein
MDIYLHSPYVFMAWCLVKHRIRLHGVVLSYTQGQLYLHEHCSSKFNIFSVKIFHLPSMLLGYCQQEVCSLQLQSNNFMGTRTVPKIGL